MNLGLIALDRPTEEFAGVYTSNLMPGWPVRIGRDRLGGRAASGVLVNNRIANVCSPGGREDAERLLASLGRLVGRPAAELFPASTGIIGWRLPVAEMEAALGGLAAGLDARSALPLARAIMTTDRFPKLHRAEAGPGSIVAVAKGAGMMEPNLATMLCFVMTDVSVGREELRASLRWAAGRTLNRLSVDSDQSTSDTVLALGSGARGAVDPAAFREALASVLGRIAEDIVRNGEGASHVIRVRVGGARSEAEAVAAGKAVVNSPLVKTAICGNDPNVGRIACAIGDWAGNAGVPLEADRVEVRLGGEEVFSGGAFRLDARKEDRLCAYLRSCAFDPALRGWPQHDRCVELEVSLGMGQAVAAVLGADLSSEYVRENGDYRS